MNSSNRYTVDRLSESKFDKFEKCLIDIASLILKTQWNFNLHLHLTFSLIMWSQIIDLDS